MSKKETASAWSAQWPCSDCRTDVALGLTAAADIAADGAGQKTFILRVFPAFLATYNIEKRLKVVYIAYYGKPFTELPAIWHHTVSAAT